MTVKADSDLLESPVHFLTPDFYHYELACKEKEGFKLPGKELEFHYLRVALALQAAREETKVPIIITSWFRTPEHNQKVGGAEGSQHLIANAADGYIDKELSWFDTFQILLESGFTGIGLYETEDEKKWRFHVDMRAGGILYWVKRQGRPVFYDSIPGLVAYIQEEDINE